MSIFTPDDYKKDAIKRGKLGKNLHEESKTSVNDQDYIQVL